MLIYNRCSIQYLLLNKTEERHHSGFLKIYLCVCFCLGPKNNLTYFHPWSTLPSAVITLLQPNGEKGIGCVSGITGVSDPRRLGREADYARLGFCVGT